MTAREGRSIASALLVGVALAAAMGVAFESWILFAQMAAGDYAIPLAARMTRLLWVASGAALAALAFGLLAAAVGRGRGVEPRGVVGLGVGVGLGFCLWLVWVFLVAAPDPSAIRLTSDPILLRLRAMIAASVVLPVGVFACHRLLRDRWDGWATILSRLIGGAAALGVVAMCLPGGGQSAEGLAPDVFLFSVDTLRADHLGCYGYPLPTSPRLDALCEESIVFENAMAPAPATIPSYTSIMTGVMQREHGVYSNYEKFEGDLATLAERLAGAGYITGAIIDGSFPGTFANVARGFDEVVQRGVTARSSLPSLAEGMRSLASAVLGTLGERLLWETSPTTRDALRWLAELPADRPVFAHFYWPFPHDPYRPPPRFLAQMPSAETDPEVAGMIRRYDAEIRYTDSQMALLLEALADRSRAAEAWILFTADHGEELGRRVIDDSGEPARYSGHSRYLFDSSIRVPLVVRPPEGAGLAPRREAAVVSTASIAATVLAVSGVGEAEDLLMPLPLEADAEIEDRAFSVARSPIKPVDLVSLRKGEWRLVEQRKPSPALALYRYDADGESVDLADEHPDRVAELLGEIHAWDPPAVGGGESGERYEISDRERERLEALGYMF